MQLQSTLARLAAFAFFLLSFSMLACAAPAPVPIPGTGALAVRDSSLVARTDYTSQCNSRLVQLEIDVKAKCGNLVTCSKTPGCDCAPILAQVAGLIDVFIKEIEVKVAAGATIDVTVVIGIWIRILVYILAQLQACVGLTVAICAKLAATIAAYVNLCLNLCISIALRLTIVLQIKAALGFNLLLNILGLL
ncbi:hypothetical protein FRC10_002611 [Ceratobasidium sp. 414]|nr:hypothetical protein FRC10_002611 [Ceratobasidium sp. 414]